MSRRVIHLREGALPDDASHAFDLLSGADARGTGLQHQQASLAEGLAAPADIVVSHLPPGWRMLSYLTRLRAARPDTPIIHVEHRFCEEYSAAHELDRKTTGSLLSTSYALSDLIVVATEAQALWILRRQLAPASKVRVIVPCSSRLSDVSILPWKRDGASRIGLTVHEKERSAHSAIAQALSLSDDPTLRLQISAFSSDLEPLIEHYLGDTGVTIEPNGVMPIGAKGLRAIALANRWGSDAVESIDAARAGLAILTTRPHAVHPAVRRHVVDVQENTPSGWVDALRRLSSLSQQEAGQRINVRTLQKQFVTDWTAMVRVASSQSADITVAA